MTNKTPSPKTIAIPSRLRLLLSASVLSLSCGCSLFPSSVQIPIANDDLDRWSGRINTMPVELHDSVKHSVTVARFENTPPSACAATSDAPASAGAQANCSRQRVIVYVGANEIPERTHFCADAPTLIPTVAAPADKIFVHAGLCDGQRTVSVARRAVQTPLPADLSPVIGRIRADLLQALWPEPTNEEGYSNMPSQPAAGWVGTF